jgi:uncharacterized protein (TIGR02646 family)
MRFIPKTPEPACFTDWKQQANANWQPTWENFQKPEKTDVLAALLQEQGHICCYCGQRISPTISHIEHLKPRKHFPAEKLSYSNFLASCPGYPEDEKQELKPLQEFCGHKKSEWYDPDLLVSPLDPNCAEYFRYTAAGEILPTNNLTQKTAAKTTIERLGLDNSKLDRRREKAIAGLGITDLTLNLTEAEIRQLIQGLNQPDANGELTPFCPALIYQLKDYLGD